MLLYGNCKKVTTDLVMTSYIFSLKNLHCRSLLNIYHSLTCVLGHLLIRIFIINIKKLFNKIFNPSLLTFEALFNKRFILFYLFIINETTLFWCWNKFLVSRAVICRSDDQTSFLNFLFTHGVTAVRLAQWVSLSLTHGVMVSKSLSLFSLSLSLSLGLVWLVLISTKWVSFQYPFVFIFYFYLNKAFSILLDLWCEQYGEFSCYILDAKLFNDVFNFSELGCATTNDYVGI